MVPDDAEPTLQSMLRAEDLDGPTPDPWRAWKSFKRFMSLPVDADDDVASVQMQFRRFKDQETRLSLLLVRQFSDAAGGWLLPVHGVALELSIRIPGKPLLKSQEFWSFEFDSLHMFAQEVEATQEFQAAMNGHVFAAGVFSEDATTDDWD